ncbi:hypothetical protein PTTG_29960 [Puccinia triticina 1-1 BBBD Race 1]|uniref:Secreted protein n=1 Tax=Puccinia triticina (isolate 1-1 / race 1 (BBBD)) TaxID=630390 RepID=A0A180G0V7_PUCT1|nr:hypothetical protein PTTG_29960 [Puccinia triticina 1-1 BBBD Race 1]WAR61477.1 hypothetical protein PtB15_12B162 [Puccinia triticina]
MKLATLPQAIFLAVLLLSSTIWAGFTCCANCGESTGIVRQKCGILRKRDYCGFPLGNGSVCGAESGKQFTHCNRCVHWTIRNYKPDCGHDKHHYTVDPATGVRTAAKFPFRKKGRPITNPTNAVDASTSAGRAPTPQDPSNSAGHSPTSYPFPYFEYL